MDSGEEVTSTVAGEMGEELTPLRVGVLALLSFFLFLLDLWVEVMKPSSSVLLVSERLGDGATMIWMRF